MNFPRRISPVRKVAAVAGVGLSMWFLTAPAFGAAGDPKGQAPGDHNQGYCDDGKGGSCGGPADAKAPGGKGPDGKGADDKGPDGKASKNESGNEKKDGPKSGDAPPNGDGTSNANEETADVDAGVSESADGSLSTHVSGPANTSPAPQPAAEEETDPQLGEGKFFEKTPDGIVERDPTSPEAQGRPAAPVATPAALAAPQVQGVADTARSESIGRATQVAGVQVTRAADGSAAAAPGLAATGSDPTTGLLRLAGIVLGLGGALMALAERRTVTA